MHNGLLTTIIAASCLFWTGVARSDYAAPMDTGRITSTPGWRMDPFGSGRKTYHRGYDIAAPTGTPVKPTKGGTVSFAGPHRDYGYLVAVDHGDGFVTMYGHLSKILLPVGTKVTTASVLALSGSTGRSTGPHLHYEIRQWPGARGSQAPPDIPGGVPSDHDEEWVDKALGIETAAKASTILRENEWIKGM